MGVCPKGQRRGVGGIRIGVREILGMYTAGWVLSQKGKESSFLRKV